MTEASKVLFRSSRLLFGPWSLTGEELEAGFGRLPAHGAEVPTGGGRVAGSAVHLDRYDRSVPINSTYRNLTFRRLRSENVTM